MMSLFPLEFNGFFLRISKVYSKGIFEIPVFQMGSVPILISKPSEQPNIKCFLILLAVASLILTRLTNS